jgi:hypothetical protein
MTPEKIKRSLRRLQHRLASRRRRHLAFLRQQAARWKAVSTAAWRTHTRLAAIELESRHGVRRRPTRQELRVEAGFQDAIRDLEPV